MVTGPVPDGGHRLLLAEPGSGGERLAEPVRRDFLSARRVSHGQWPSLHVYTQLSDPDNVRICREGCD